MNLLIGNVEVYIVTKYMNEDGGGGEGVCVGKGKKRSAVYMCSVEDRFFVHFYTSW